MSPTVPVGSPPEPPAAPVYQKILTHAGREYRVGTCNECDKENVILSSFHGRIVAVSGLCLSCISMAEKEIAQASSQLHAAKAGGTYGERKVEPTNDPLGKTIKWQYFGKLPGTP
jgi:hypothetical protein